MAFDRDAHAAALRKDDPHGVCSNSDIDWLTDIAKVRYDLEQMSIPCEQMGDIRNACLEILRLIEEDAR